jgi:hypothetical protein
VCSCEESEHLRAELGAANALLEQPNWRSWTIEQWLDWEERRGTHLSGQAPARTDHERAVLTAMSGVSTPILEMFTDCAMAKSEELVQACERELARREAAGG